MSGGTAKEPNMKVYQPTHTWNQTFLPVFERDLQIVSFCHKDQLGSSGWCIIMFTVTLSIHYKRAMLCHSDI